MKKFWSFLCMATIFWVHILSCVEGTDEYLQCDKIYVESTQLFVSEYAIYVTLDTRIIETNAIFSDHHGLYFTDYKQKKCDKGYWQCRICGHCNPNYKIWCEVCSN